MVHRIQNTNPGYSDFTNIGPTPSFNFSNNGSSPVSHGANALKLEDEIASSEPNQSMVEDQIKEANNEYHEEILKNHQIENVVENSSNEEEISFTQEATNEKDINNDLSEFGVNSESPDLFSSDNDASSSDDLLSTENEEQDDDLEIPAFLRRQKN